ncbi:MAG: ARMT1-like domain-containing protein [Chloroflexota bacterium]|nr:ARMT1-like domain-containing protein [Chloroflexota bacterium]
MRTYLDCLPCLLNQALKAARAATADEEIHRKVLNSFAEMIPSLSLGLKPPEIAQQCYQLVRQLTGNGDPFREAKAEANRAALALYPRLKETVADSEDPLLTACKLAIAGNSIDLGPSFDHGDIESIVKTALMSPLVVNHYEQFLMSIKNARRILYLGDNAGEIVFDRLLIEEIRRMKELEIDFVVRESPVINDATMEDALATGMDKIARIISNGSDAPATILSQCSPEMLKLYHSADVIISKGQGNYESLSEEPENIFFLLRVKCPLLAELVGVEVGDAVLEQNLARVNTL